MAAEDARQRDEQLGLRDGQLGGFGALGQRDASVRYELPKVVRVEQPPPGVASGIMPTTFGEQQKQQLQVPPKKGRPLAGNTSTPLSPPLLGGTQRRAAAKKLTVGGSSTTDPEKVEGGTEEDVSKAAAVARELVEATGGPKKMLSPPSQPLDEGDAADKRSSSGAADAAACGR